MYTAKSNSTGSPLRFVFWWLLANLAETAINIRSTLTGVESFPRTGPIGGHESSGGVTLPSRDPIQATVSPSGTGHWPLATGNLSLRPLALAGLVAYVMGIAVVLLIRAQIA